MAILRWVALGSLFAACIGWQSTCGAPIGMPAGSKVWMKFESGACPDADGDDCAGSNQAGPNPPHGIPLSSFSNGTTAATGYAEILPDRIRTLARGDFGGGGFGGAFMHASFEDTYLVGGTAAGPFDIPVELRGTGFARSSGSGACSLCHQLVAANGEAKIGTFQTFTDPTLGEGLRVSPFDPASRADFFFPTEASGSPFERPIDVTARYTVQDVSVGDTFVLAFGMNSRFSRGEIDLLNTGSISFDLPEGAFLISALAKSLLPLPGDYNGNGIVDAADYTVWRDTLDQTGTGLAADGNGDDMISQLDYDVWKTHFGESAGSGSAAIAHAAVPEPVTAAMLLAAVLAMCAYRCAVAS